VDGDTDGAYSMHGRLEKFIQSFGSRIARKTPIRISRQRRENNIKIKLEKNRM
jgi:hypothetical protein